MRDRWTEDADVGGGEPGELRYEDVQPEAGPAAGMAVGGIWLVVDAAVLVAVALAVIAAHRQPRHADRSDR